MSGCLEKTKYAHICFWLSSNWPIKKKKNSNPNHQNNTNLENQDENNLKNNSEWTEKLFVTFPHYLSYLEIKSHGKSKRPVLT